MSIKHGSPSNQEIRRLQAGELILRDFDNNEAIEITGASLSSVKRWRTIVQRDGAAALARKPQSGRPKELTDTQRQGLKTIPFQGARSFGYLTDRWTTRIDAVKNLTRIHKKWDVDNSQTHVGRILHLLGFSYQKPTVKSTKFSQTAVDHWRKYVRSRIKKIRKRAVSP